MTSVLTYKPEICLKIQGMLITEGKIIGTETKRFDWKHENGRMFTNETNMQLSFVGL